MQEVTQRAGLLLRKGVMRDLVSNDKNTPPSAAADIPATKCMQEALAGQLEHRSMSVVVADARRTSKYLVFPKSGDHSDHCILKYKCHLHDSHVYNVKATFLNFFPSEAHIPSQIFLFK